MVLLRFYRNIGLPSFLYWYYIYCINITSKIQVKFGFLCIIYNVLKFCGQLRKQKAQPTPHEVYPKSDPRVHIILIGCAVFKLRCV